MNGTEHKQALSPGYQLGGYRVLDVLGVGGFGVTYLAQHATLGHRVAIKEYLPNEFAVRDGTAVHPKSGADRDDFEWGLVRFLDEAKTLARFEHRNLVRVRDYFEANRTAYIVMDYEEGELLDGLLDSHGTLTEAQLRRVLLPIIDGLREVHAAGYLHRDIKPSNVYVRRSDESPVLLDFGAARQALGRKSKSLTAVASAGYSPPEQYESEGEQGPWTDVYALSALCYRAITGQSPIEAPRRMNRLAQGQPDPLPKLAQTAREGYSPSFLEAVDQGLDVIAANRPPNLDDWVTRLAGVSITSGTNRAPLRREAAGAERGVRRGKAWAVAASVAALAVASVLAVWITREGKVLSLPVGTTTAQPEVSSTPSPTAKPEAREGDARVIGGGAILVVETEPDGVEVHVGGTVVGDTPLERTDLRAGVREVTLRHPYYQTVILSDQAFADGEVLRIERALSLGVGKLTVVTRPRDAWIERDGEHLAAGTPVTLEGLPSGPVELTLGADEHRAIRVRVEVPKDGVAMLDRTLERIPHGTLTLELTPPDATVTLPDIAPAYRPGMGLPEGRHRVVVARSGYRQVTRTVEVAGATRERIELALDPRPFTITAVPAEATIRFVDLDEDYLPGMRLAPGDYRVRVSARGYETREDTVRHGTEPTRREVTLERGIPPPGGTFAENLRSGGRGPEMVVISAGRFRMGCLSNDSACYPDEKPVREVRIPRAFALSVHEVTFAQWKACAAAGGCGGYRPSDAGWGRGDRPVINVSWEDVQSYVSWLSGETGEDYRLPSESEWEYAARAGATTKYSWGNRIGGNRANCDGCGSQWDEKQTALVGSFGPNGFGLRDMHGNVWEWVEDCWNESYEGAPSDGSAWTSSVCVRRVLRGGSWDRDPRNLRAAYRYWDSTGSRDVDLGFRVARTLTL